MSVSLQNHKDATVVGFFTVIRIMILTVPSIFGIILGYIIPYFAKWLLTLLWVPFQEPIEIITSFPEKWAAIVTAFIGLMAGVWFSREAIRDSLVISVSDKEVQL